MPRYFTKRIKVARVVEVVRLVAPRDVMVGVKTLYRVRVDDSLIPGT